MNPYNPESKCPKCGYEKAQAMYQAPFTFINGENDCPESMRSLCSNCGYIWNEKPLDVEQ